MTSSSILGRAGSTRFQNEGGYMMAELLVSFSLLLMLITLFVPQGVHLLQERKNMKLSYQASLILKEKAVEALETGRGVQEQTITRESASYQIWEEAFDEERKICIVWTDARKKENSRCQTVTL